MTPETPDVEIPVEHRFVKVNGLQLHVVEAGPEDGPLIVLLHGFPEFWYGWRKQIAPLAEAGFRVMVPDQRGYNRSDKPEGVDAYRMERLAGDVVALIQGTGKLRAVLVGHDWGAAVAWWVALTSPEVVERLVILNVPHPKVMRETLQQSWSQRFKSWYILFFQVPWFPELLLSWGNYHGLSNALQSSSREGTFSREDLLRYRKAWGRKGVLTAMLNWYRGVRLAWGQEIPHDGVISVETLMIWGDRDRFLGSEMAEPSIRLCPKGRLVHIQEATHWVQHEEAERVNDLILSFVRSADCV